MSSRDLWLLLFAAAISWAGALVIAGPARALGLKLRAMSPEKRKFIGGVCVGIAAGLLTALVAASIAVLTANHDGCDATMFVAAHPKLPPSDDAAPETLVVRFVLLMREVSPSQECNARSLREARDSSSEDVMHRFANDLKNSGRTQQYIDRRHQENVSVEMHAVEASAAAQWRLSWTEHVRSPAGVDLRNEDYVADLRTRPSSRDAHDFEVSEFHVQPATLGASR